MKKDESRFTIRFNLADPRHLRAMNALKTSGRRKASLIADAVCEYLSRNGGDGAAVTQPLARTPILAANNTVSGDASHSKIPESEENEGTIISSADIPIDDDMRDAILGGLSAFQA